MAQPPISLGIRANNWVADHKVALSFVGIGLGLLIAAVGAVALASLLKNPAFFGPVNTIAQQLGDPFAYSMLAAGGALIITTLIVAFCVKKKVVMPNGTTIIPRLIVETLPKPSIEDAVITQELATYIAQADDKKVAALTWLQTEYLPLLTNPNLNLTLQQVADLKQAMTAVQKVGKDFKKSIPTHLEAHKRVATEQIFYAHARLWMEYLNDSGSAFTDYILQLPTSLLPTVFRHFLREDDRTKALTFLGDQQFITKQLIDNDGFLKLTVIKESLSPAEKEHYFPTPPPPPPTEEELQNRERERILNKHMRRHRFLCIRW